MSSTPPLQATGLLGSISSVASKISTVVAKSTFTNSASIENMNASQTILFFIMLIFLIYLTMWLGTFVFNTSVIKIFPSIKKVTTLDFFGLYIVLHLLFC
jgi:hypothetical protein